MQKARRHRTPKCSTPTDDKHAVSGSISLPSRGAFHLSLTVLLHYRSPKVFSLTRWSSLIHPGFLVPRATRVLATSLNPFRIRDYHPLWSYFPICSPIDLKTLSQVPLPPDYSGFRLFPVRSPLLRKSFLLSLPAGTKMFQFSALASHTEVQDVTVLAVTGCPIRTPTGLSSLTALRGFSQLTASFVAFWCQGIHHMPFLLRAFLFLPLIASLIYTC